MNICQNSTILLFAYNSTAGKWPVTYDVTGILPVSYPKLASSGGAGGRVGKSHDHKQAVSGSNPGAAETVGQWWNYW